jgi:hypothetical protein
LQITSRANRQFGLILFCYYPVLLIGSFLHGMAVGVALKEMNLVLPAGMGVGRNEFDHG